MTNTLWEYAISVYERNGAANRFLALQDQLGADVNMVLYLCWRAASGRPAIPPKRLEALCQSIEPLRTVLAEPLRRARRSAKSCESDDDGAIYDILKSVELEAEHLELDILEADAEAIAGSAARNRDTERSVATVLEQLDHYWRLLGVVPDPDQQHLISELMSLVFRPSDEWRDG